MDSVRFCFLSFLFSGEKRPEIRSDFIYIREKTFLITGKISNGRNPGIQQNSQIQHRRNNGLCVVLTRLYAGGEFLNATGIEFSTVFNRIRCSAE